MNKKPIKSKRKKYPIESTTEGYPQLERALFKANDEIGWKGLTAFLVQWTNQHQPKDTVYCVAFWKPKKIRYTPPKTVTITEKEYKMLKSKSK